MHLSSFLLPALALAPPLISSHPVLNKRTLSQSDISVLSLALYLEHLEYALYSGGYEAFTAAQYEADGLSSTFRDNVLVIAQHEAIHAATITNVLEDNGVAPIPNCTYKFPYTSPKSFVSLANMITSVGIGAYLGGSLSLTDNPTLLTTAGSILTVEARHDAYLRTGLSASPFPNAFDTSLTALWSFSLAQMFIVSCPVQLPLTPLPALTLVSPMQPAESITPVPAGTALTFMWDPSKFFVSVDPNAPLYIAMINQDLAPIFQEVTIVGTGMGTVPVPEGTAGAAFAVLTTFAGPLTAMELSQFGTLAIGEVILE